MRALGAICLMTLLAVPGCVEAHPKMSQTPTSAEDPCGAAAYQHLIGQPGDTARALELDQPVRVIPSGAAVTMDYLERRINFDLNDSGIIIRVRCG